MRSILAEVNVGTRGGSFVEKKQLKRRSLKSNLKLCYGEEQIQNKGSMHVYIHIPT
jgi:hypothetical protein